MAADRNPASFTLPQYLLGDYDRYLDGLELKVDQGLRLFDFLRRVFDVRSGSIFAELMHPHKMAAFRDPTFSDHGKVRPRLDLGRIEKPKKARTVSVLNVILLNLLCRWRYSIMSKDANQTDSE